MPQLYDTLRTWAEVDLDVLENNFHIVRSHLPQTMKLLAVVKANAYGHGSIEVSKLLEGKADYFAVAMMDEAAELRMIGIQTPVMVLGAVQPSDYPRAVKYQVAIPVLSVQQAKEMSQFATKTGSTLRVHLTVDTGMSRIGFLCTQSALEEVESILPLPGLEWEGVFSHLALADAGDQQYTRQQMERFDSFLEALKNRGISFPIRHMYNSAAIAALPPRYDMVRAGIVLYGMGPSKEMDLSHLGDIRPAMALRSHITQVKTLPAGVAISYGCTYCTQRETVVATIASGYADGVPRALSNQGRVLIRGTEAPILGRVCMDQMMVDVTEISGVSVGDTVTIFGTDGSKCITANEVAESYGSIGYELISNIDSRVPRVYLRGGKVEQIRRVLPGE